MIQKSSRKKIIIANWKANPDSLMAAEKLFLALVDAASVNEAGVQTVVCPPFVFLSELSKILKANYRQPPLALGAQDVFWREAGPFTGEITPRMLKNFGLSYVLIGHSERRYLLGENEEIINQKIKAALTAELTPVLLVGEKEKSDYRPDILVDQLSRDLEGLSPFQVRRVIVVYEPVWAISTQVQGQADDPQRMQESWEIIRDLLTKNWGIKDDYPLFFYGGSVNSQNVESFLRSGEVQGAVVGGASLNFEDFSLILKNAASLMTNP